MKQTLCSIASNVVVMPGVYLVWIEAPDIAAAAQPGQFITVRCKDFTLRRPFSIHQVGDRTAIASPEAIGTKQSQVAILFKVTGKGTLWLSQRKPGEKIDVLGPLGNGFNIEPGSQNLLLLAGGIGIAPLFFLMQQASSRHQITLIHGASTTAQLYAGRCQPSAISCHRVQFIPVTEDGSTGQKGLATDVLPDFLDWADQIYACGPAGMYEAMTQMSSGVDKGKLKLRKCQVSLEVRMGCGFGACYGCTINTKKGSRQVCRDGPVFGLDDIIWQEVRI